MADPAHLTFEQISSLNARKDTLKEKHVKYIEAHPELKDILNDFLSRVLLDKPSDVRAFAKEHFSAYLPPPPENVPFVICGPSGVGKGTLIKKLTEEFADAFGFSVSHTTRGPREGEVDGVHYHFSEKEAMEAKIAAGEFIESAHVHGNIYGTSKQAVRSVADAGKVCILDIDVQGAKAVKGSDLQPHLVYIAPPSREELESRLRGRGTETEEAIEKRLQNAYGEMEWLEQEGNVDFTVVNDNLDEAYGKLRAQLLSWYPNFVKEAVEEVAEEKKTEEKKEEE